MTLVFRLKERILLFLSIVDLEINSSFFAEVDQSSEEFYNEFGKTYQRKGLYNRALVSDIVAIVIAVSDSIDSDIRYIFTDCCDSGTIAILSFGVSFDHYYLFMNNEYL